MVSLELKKLRLVSILKWEICVWKIPAFDNCHRWLCGDECHLKMERFRSTPPRGQSILNYEKYRSMILSLIHVKPPTGRRCFDCKRYPLPPPHRSVVLALIQISPREKRHRAFPVIILSINIITNKNHPLLHQIMAFSWKLHRPND